MMSEPPFMGTLTPNFWRAKLGAGDSQSVEFIFGESSDGLNDND